MINSVTRYQKLWPLENFLVVSGEELAPPKRTKISEEILTNELNPNNATKTD
jgi:hypothetical protein